MSIGRQDLETCPATLFLQLSLSLHVGLGPSPLIVLSRPSVARRSGKYTNTLFLHKYLHNPNYYARLPGHRTLH